jgi:hypothetical protein
LAIQAAATGAVLLLLVRSGGTAQPGADRAGMVVAASAMLLTAA